MFASLLDLPPRRLVMPSAPFLSSPFLRPSLLLSLPLPCSFLHTFSFACRLYLSPALNSFHIHLVFCLSLSHSVIHLFCLCLSCFLSSSSLSPITLDHFLRLGFILPSSGLSLSPINLCCAPVVSVAGINKQADLLSFKSESIGWSKDLWLDSTPSPPRPLYGPHHQLAHHHFHC